MFKVFQAAGSEEGHRFILSRGMAPLSMIFRKYFGSLCYNGLGLWEGQSGTGGRGSDELCSESL